MAQIEDSYLIDLQHRKDFSQNKTGDIQQIKGLANLKQAIFHRLVTVPGSIVHRPEYGIGIQRFQNDIQTVDKQRKIALLVKSELEKDERIEKVINMKFEQDQENQGTFILTIRYKPIGYDETSTVFNPFGATI